ncbi:MAG: RNA-binding S4 domain-containing protein [Bacteroidia bacterium]|nr:RNA-binding S4 domain-containing protein [Bacteroidia bacterium]
MKQHSFTLTTQYIELIKLLKFIGIASDGADAKNLVEQNMVFSNGVPELRKRYKVRVGDVITCGDHTITIS